MSENLTIITKNHYFSVELAKQLGDPMLACVLQFFMNMISKHAAMGRNESEGRTWNYVTYEELVAEFPYLSYDQIKRLLKKLTDKKILMSANLNRNRWDHTRWYAFVDEEKWGISKIKYDRAKSPDREAKSPDRTGEIAPSKPMSNTVSNPSIYQDNVNETLPRYASDGKTMDPVRRWKLNPDQADSFAWLKSQNLGADDPTLAYWVKTYSRQRMSEVMQCAKKYAKTNVGGYMNKLLKKGAIVENDQSKINKKTAEDYKKEMAWPSLEILEKYAKVVLASGSPEEIPYNMDPMSFFTKLVTLHEIA